MGIQEEQERRRDLLLKALEACSDPEQALTVAVRMEQFITNGQALREQPQEPTQLGGQMSMSNHVTIAEVRSAGDKQPGTHSDKPKHKNPTESIRSSLNRQFRT